MAVELRVVTTRRELRKFVKFPFTLYKDCRQWVPPLISDEMNTLRADRNPAFEFCQVKYWLAFRNGEVVGRIAGIINQRCIDKWKHRYARFDWVDFIDDRRVSSALFQAVEDWALSQGMEGVNGPMGFTDLDPEGLLIEGHDELGTILMLYNHAYYQDHIEALGYGKDTDWLEYEIKAPVSIPERVQRLQDMVLKRSGLTLVKARRSRELSKYVKTVFDIINETYTDLYGFVEYTDKQIQAYAKQYFSFIDPKYSKMIVDQNGRGVAFCVALPSLSKAFQRARGRLLPLGVFHILKALKRPKAIDLGLVAVRREYQKMGLHAILMAEVTKSAIADGVRTAESAAELEENEEIHALWKHYETRQHKRRRAYLKLL